MQPSNNALNISVTESEHDVTQEFLKQNQIIDEQLNKYDSMLDSWPMIIYRIWLGIYVAGLGAGVITLLYFIIFLVQNNDERKYFGGVGLLLCIWLLVVSIYGSVQMRIGLYARDITRVDKCLVIFGKTAGYSISSSLSLLLGLGARHLLTWQYVGLCLAPTAIALLNLFPAAYAKDTALNITSKGDVTQEFLKQNQIIDEELGKYDSMLDSWPMRIYRVWIFIYVAALSTGIAIMSYDILSVLGGGNNVSTFDAIFMAVGIIFLIISIYGSVQMRMGLYYRDIARVDKCLNIFETTAGYSIYFAVMGFMKLWVNRLLEEKFVALFVGVVAIALINLYPARYARGVLAKRNVFQKVSSHNPAI